MNRDEVTRRDFPEAPEGYDRASVDAHLDAVAATIAALEARIHAVEVERDALRRTPAPGPSEPARLPTPIAAVPDLEPVDEVEPLEPTAPLEAAEPDETAEVVVPAGGAEGTGAPAQDESSARLVAMKMALDGAGREEILKRLGDEYELADADGLVDDVISRVG